MHPAPGTDPPRHALQAPQAHPDAPASSDSTPAAEADRLLRAGARAVLRYLAAHTDTPLEAEELAQETLVRAFAALARGERPRKPEAWLIGIARHVLLETWRGERARQRLRERQERESYAMGPGWEGLAGMDGVDRRLVVGQALDGLPPDLRVPVLLHYFGGLPVSDVAAHLETTPSAVKMRLLRARLALRAHLQADAPDWKGSLAMPPFPASPSSRTTPASPASRPARRTARPASHTPAHGSDAAVEPLYRSLSAGLETGGTRGATDPLSEPPHFSGGALSLEDLRFAIDRLHAARLAGERPLCAALDFWCAPDPFNHPDPPAAWALVYAARVAGTAGTGTDEEPSRLVPTDSSRLGTDPDWRPLLERFKAAGLTHVWFTFLGLQDVHDSLGGRPGAFADVVAGMERCAAAGLKTGANIILSTRNVHQLLDLSRLVRRLGGQRFVPTYPGWFSPRGAVYEAIRPEPQHLAGLPPPDLDANWGYKDFWANPAAHTEAALAHAAIEAAPPPTASPADPSAHPAAPSPETPPPSLGLIVDAALNVHAGGWWGHPLPNVANLRADSPEAIHRKLAALLPLPTPPPDAELARRYADPDSRRLHTRLDSVRRKWLHAWVTEHHIPWLP